MIFSKEICPICKGPVTESLPHEEPVYTFVPTNFFCCEKKVKVRNFTDTNNIWHTHYCLYEYVINDQVTSDNVELIYPPYKIAYGPSSNKMGVYLIREYRSEVFLFQAPLIKVDFSDSEKVINKLKLLSLLS